jgi:hypothetical protein
MAVGFQVRGHCFPGDGLTKTERSYERCDDVNVAAVFGSHADTYVVVIEAAPNQFKAQPLLSLPGTLAP